MNQTQHAAWLAAPIRRAPRLALVLAVFVTVALSAPAASMAGGGICGAPYTQYFQAYEHKHCGPIGAANWFLMYATDSAGNQTNSNVCVRGEYPTVEAAIPGYDWSCGDRQAVIDFPTCCMSVRGGYLNNWPYPHYGQMYYYFY